MSANTIHERGVAFQAADCLGYIPILSFPVGAARTVVSLVTAFFAGGGYAATATFEKLAKLVTPTYECQEAKDKCNFVVNRALAEAERGLWLEIIASVVPFAALYVDSYPEQFTKGPLSACAKGSYVDSSGSIYFNKKPASEVSITELASDATAPKTQEPIWLTSQPKGVKGEDWDVL